MKEEKESTEKRGVTEMNESGKRKKREVAIGLEKQR